MESVIRCRKCGKKMRSVKVDDYKIKSYCECGYLEYKTASAASKTINPHLSKQNLMPLVFDEHGRFFVEVERADREKQEIMTLAELSMLASSDYDIRDVLKSVAEKTAVRIGVDICSIYLWEGDCLVLEGTFGLSQGAVGVARLKSGEGITGSALEKHHPLLIEDVSTDERYHFFPETKEEQYKIKSMYTYPIFSGDEPFGALNIQTVVTKEFTDDELSFVAVVANLILGAVKLRKRG